MIKILRPIFGHDWTWTAIKKKKNVREVVYVCKKCGKKKTEREKAIPEKGQQVAIRDD